MLTAVSDTAANATDDVTATTAVLSRETTASDPRSRLLSTLAPGVSPGVSQITTTVTPIDAAASTPNAVIQLSLVTATVTDVQTPNVEVPVISPPVTAVVVTDKTDTGMAFINKVSPSARAVSLTTEAVAQANDLLTPADDVIASAMDYAAPTTISASLATDEVAQAMNEMNGTIIPTTSGSDLATEIVPLSTNPIMLDLDAVIQEPGAASTTKAVATAKNTPSSLRTVSPISLPVIPAPESAETPPPDASPPKAPLPEGFNLKALVPEPNAPEVAVPEAAPPDVTLAEVAVPEASLSEASIPKSPEGPPQIQTSKSVSRDPAPPPEALPPDTPSLEASAPEFPPLDAVGSKAPLTSTAVSLPDALHPNALLPIPKAKQEKTDLPPIDEKEKSESAKSRDQGKEERKPGTFPYCNYNHSRYSQNACG